MTQELEGDDNTPIDLAAELAGHIQSDTPAENQPPPAVSQDEHVVASEPATQAPAASTAAPATDTAATIAPETTPSTLARDAFAAKTGLDVSKYKSDEDFFLGFANLARAMGERSEAAQLGRWVQENPQEALARLQERFGQPAAPATTTAQPTTTKPSDALPEWNPAWRPLLRKDENGRTTVVEGADPRYAAAYDAYMERAEKLLFNPVEALKPELDRVRQQAKEEALAEFQRMQTEQTHRSTAQQTYNRAMELLTSNADKLFEGGDPNGSPTPLGQSYQQFLMHVAKADMTPEERHQYAWERANFELQKQATAAKPSPKAHAAAINRPRVAAPQPTTEEFGDNETLEQAFQRMNAAGVSVFTE